MKSPSSKLHLKGKRTTIDASYSIKIITDTFVRLGCSQSVSLEVAEHLTDASLCGMESHGIMRTIQYAEQMNSGYIKPKAKTKVFIDSKGVKRVSGGGGIGIPTMKIAYSAGLQDAKKYGISVLSVRNVGHTGRHGAFADEAAEKGFLTICLGGGNRKIWRQVAPYGGAEPMLPTNPWCIGIPGGSLGPIILDFATSKIAGGWIYAARSAKALLPKNSVIDKHGKLTRNPEDYFDGGAILPAGAQKGYGLALMGEIIAEAMLGPSTTEANWLLISLDVSRFREKTKMHQAAEEVLSEIRNCRPSKGFDQVEIPGERERNHRQVSNGKIAVPKETWVQIMDLHNSLNAQRL